jgi:ATP-binding cassette, subfamily B, bacterial MsbA
MKILRRILAFAGTLRHYFPEYLLFTIVGIVLGLINFTLLIPVLEILFNTGEENIVESLPAFEPSISYFKQVFYYYLGINVAAYGKMGALIFVSIIIIISNLLANVFRYLAIKVIIRLRFNIMANIRRTLYDKYTRLHLSYYHKKKKGDLINTLMNEVSEIDHSLINSFQVFMRDPFTIIIYLFGLFYMSAELTLFTIVFFPVSAIIISTVTKKLKKIGRYSQELTVSMLSLVEETLSGLKIIQSFTAQKLFGDKFSKINQDFSKTGKSLYSKRELASPISEFSGILVVIGLVLYGGYLIIESRSALTGSMFIAYLAIYSQLLPPFKNLSGAFSQMQRGLVAGEKILGVIDEPEMVVDNPASVPKKSFDREINIQNISFGYNETKVLKNISINIPKGSTVALVGESGAGKSTLSDLIARFYDVNEGSINIDGIDIRQIQLHDLRSLIGIVTQDAVLFNDTVFNNIAFNNPNASIEEVTAAAKIANAHEFIEQLEDGYNTFIGDRGMRLSGGQRQRMTIARAVLKNPPVLILDEATSALDTESEKLVQDALEKLMKDRTSIIIAHRLSTVKNSDIIVVLKKGEVAETGSHTDLIAQNGYYARLVQMQEVK